MEVENTSDRTIVYDVEVFFIYEATFEIELGKARPFRSMILPAEVMDYPITESKSKEVNLHGGGWKGILKKALTGLRDSPVARRLASNVADEFLEKEERDVLRKYAGVGMVGNGVSGSGLTGNRLIKKNTLKNRM
jgi:hypothetical protein